MTLREWNARLHGLVVFRALLEDPVVAKLVDLTDRMDAGASGMGLVCDAAAAFEAALFEHTPNWSDYLSNAVLESETICVRQAAAGQLSPVLQSALDSELAFLQALCGLTLDKLFQTAYSEQSQRPELAFLPRWETRELDLAAAYTQRMSEVGKKGYGMFAKHHVFTVENGQLVPVKYPDPQKLSELPGYEQEREKVIANTRALLTGMPANNVLLYGDAGTGKSSTVKAICNEFAAEGLRLVEVKKNQLYQIPDLMDKLAANPLKFILFIDDLSFTANDDNFAALKAILEGSVGGRARNIAVYATSNRRHLIKETLTDRTGDDIHEADTRQELMSLSARFGLTVTFQRPEKARFEAILTELAKQHHIEMPHDQLLVKAEAFAIRAGGRRPRGATQFIEPCESGVPKYLDLLSKRARAVSLCTGAFVSASAQPVQPDCHIGVREFELIGQFFLAGVFFCRDAHQHAAGIEPPLRGEGRDLCLTVRDRGHHAVGVHGGHTGVRAHPGDGDAPAAFQRHRGRQSLFAAHRFKEQVVLVQRHTANVRSDGHGTPHGLSVGSQRRDGGTAGSLCRHQTVFIYRSHLRVGAQPLVNINKGVVIVDELQLFCGVEIIVFQG